MSSSLAEAELLVTEAGKATDRADKIWVSLRTQLDQEAGTLRSADCKARFLLALVSDNRDDESKPRVKINQLPVVILWPDGQVQDNQELKVIRISRPRYQTYWERSRSILDILSFKLGDQRVNGEIEVQKSTREGWQGQIQLPIFSTDQRISVTDPERLDESDPEKQVNFIGIVVTRDGKAKLVPISLPLNAMSLVDEHGWLKPADYYRQVQALGLKQADRFQIEAEKQERMWQQWQQKPGEIFKDLWQKIGNNFPEQVSNDRDIRVFRAILADSLIKAAVELKTMKGETVRGRGPDSLFPTEETTTKYIQLTLDQVSFMALNSGVIRPAKRNEEVVELCLWVNQASDGRIGWKSWIEREKGRRELVLSEEQMVKVLASLVSELGVRSQVTRNSKSGKPSF